MVLHSVNGCLAHAGRGIARSWKKAVPLPVRGPLQMPGALKPNVVEAHTMELIKSMLYLADTTGDFHSATTLYVMKIAKSMLSLDDTTGEFFVFAVVFCVQLVKFTMYMDDTTGDDRFCNCTVPDEAH